MFPSLRRDGRLSQLPAVNPRQLLLPLVIDRQPVGQLRATVSALQSLWPSRLPAITSCSSAGRIFVPVEVFYFVFGAGSVRRRVNFLFEQKTKSEFSNKVRQSEGDQASLTVGVKGRRDLSRRGFNHT
jgi:hypothetical protein